MRMTLQVTNLVKNNAEKFERLVLCVPGVSHVDTWTGRSELEVSDSSIIPSLIQTLKTSGFQVRESEQTGQSTKANVFIDGMTCRSCEITVERKFKKLPWVKQVDVDAGRGTARIFCHEGCSLDLQALKQALSGETYSVRGIHEKKKESHASSVELKEKPTFFGLIGIFALVLLIWSLFGKLSIFGNSGTQGTVTFAAALILGVVAGSSSCLAIAGGLLLSSVGKFRERYGGALPSERMRPVFLFVAGRVLSYGFLGGVIGFIGKALTPSPLVTGGLTLFAALYMFIMGLEMLHIAPQWLKRLLPRIPKALSHRIVDAEGKEHWSAPMVLGAATFFLPCGFTQSLQLYALTTGSFAASAFILAGFALGTAPALLALGWASSSLKGKTGKLFFQFSGALVVVLGLFNIQNGMTIIGYPLSFPDFSIATSEAAIKTDSSMPFDGKTQVMKMVIDGGYQPSHFTIKAGTPTRWDIDATHAGGCTSVLVSRQLGIQKSLSGPNNTIEFTSPEQPGTYQFSCSMGMFRGQITVVPKT